MKIGIIHEGKSTPDKRAAFSPEQLRYILQTYPGKFQIQVERSAVRSFSDEEYTAAGITVVDDISGCEVLFGVKEVPIDQLIPGKTYFFFSHTIKRQPYNRKLLRAVLEKNIRLVDYEVLKDSNGNRVVVAFGRWAGIVGAYNALWAYGKKTALFNMKRANECSDLPALIDELKQVNLPPIKIIVTGTGRVGKGILEVLTNLKIKPVSISDFLHTYDEEPVVVVLSSQDYYRRKTDGGYDKQEFYDFPDRYESHFHKFAEQGEILISGAYWNPAAPRMFEIADLQEEDFQISVVADISCDIEGALPTTKRASTIADPVYDIDRLSGGELPAFGSQTSISVMAIDNLPCELPREASKEFGSQLLTWVIPALLETDAGILERATLARDGDLTLEFMHLRDYVYPNEK